MSYEDRDMDREREERRRQVQHEIWWTGNKIAELTKRLPKKPSVQREIDTLKHQIQHREYELLFGTCSYFMDGDV